MKALWLLGVLCLCVAVAGYAQKEGDWLLEKMPVDLETEYALSALPPHLRDGATVYLLDPTKGYYVARKGTNGFATLVCRTEWEWAEFSQETFAPISFDAVGNRSNLKVFLDVAEMRASGKYSASQITQEVVKRVKNGAYKAPEKCGVSYMLAPVMRSHPDTKEVVTMMIPHYMFYAPNVSGADIGALPNLPGAQHALVLNNENVLGKGNAIFNYIIVMAGEFEKHKNIEESNSLLTRLIEWKPAFKSEVQASHHSMK